MSFNNITMLALIDILGCVQGTVLGMLLIFNYRKNNAFLFLGGFLVTYSLDLGLMATEAFGLVEKHPQILYLPIKFFWLFMPLLFLYCKAKTYQLNWGKDWRHLISGAVEFILFSVLFVIISLYGPDFLGSSLVETIELLHIIIAALIIVVYSVLILKHLKAHSVKVQNYYSTMEGKNMIWLKWTVYYILVTAFIVPLWTIIVTHISLLIAFSVCNVIFIFWVTLSGFKQLFVFVPKESEEKPIDTQLTEEPITTSDKVASKHSVEDPAYTEILRFINEEKPFSDEHLTISDLSQKLKMPKRELSALINGKTGKNFNQFINEFRIDEAKLLLEDPKMKHLSMLGIAYEAGFSSKSSFYATFRKMTGETPAKYQSRHFQ